MSDYHCIFSGYATEERPCWGEPIYYGSTDAGDDFFTCEGHIEFSMWIGTSDEENASNYRFNVAP